MALRDIPKKTRVIHARCSLEELERLLGVTGIDRAVVADMADQEEAALEELAAEFERGGNAERDADEPGVPSSVYFDCASKVREKAAALKGDSDAR